MKKTRFWCYIKSIILFLAIFAHKRLLVIPNSIKSFDPYVFIHLRYIYEVTVVKSNGGEVFILFPGFICYRSPQIYSDHSVFIKYMDSVIMEVESSCITHHLVMLWVTVVNTNKGTRYYRRIWLNISLIYISHLIIKCKQIPEWCYLDAFCLLLRYSRV